MAAAGITRTAAGARGRAVRSVWISAHDRADYWPESEEIALQLTYRTGDAPGGRRAGGGRGRGRQAHRRGDPASASAGATLADFAQLEHAYSPPYAPALEPLAVAAMVAENTEDGVEAAAPGGGARRTRRSWTSATRRRSRPGPWICPA